MIPYDTAVNGSPKSQVAPDSAAEHPPNVIVYEAAEGLAGPGDSKAGVQVADIAADRAPASTGVVRAEDYLPGDQPPMRGSDDVNGPTTRWPRRHDLVPRGAGSL